jgi:hypothetical protein
MNTYQPKLPVGTVILRKSESKFHQSYWKIIDTHSFCNDISYGVIRCTKNGKEFKETNGFNVKYTDACVANGEIIVISINTFSVQTLGKIKRRILFLTNRIKNDSIELADLKSLLPP